MDTVVFKIDRFVDKSETEKKKFKDSKKIDLKMKIDFREKLERTYGLCLYGFYTTITKKELKSLLEEIYIHYTKFYSIEEVKNNILKAFKKEFLLLKTN